MVNKKDLIPARVFVFIPSEDNNAIILRRGPSSHVGIFRWNMKDDSIELSQWLKNGRIYEHLSDISPDGKYFIYSANKKGWGYTAISYAPWIKAISFWRNVGMWGGGIFLNNKEYVLYNGNYYNEFISEDLKVVEKTGMFSIYHERLIRNNWFVKSEESKIIVYSKYISENIELEKIYVIARTRKKGKAYFSEYHRLVYDTHIEKNRSWMWCEWINDTLYWSKEGCLYKAQLENSNKFEKPSLIYDFNPELFRNCVAPCGD